MPYIDIFLHGRRFVFSVILSLVYLFIGYGVYLLDELLRYLLPFQLYDQLYGVLVFISFGIILLIPFCTGSLMMLCSSRKNINDNRYVHTAPWLVMFLWSAISIALAWESIICVLMLAPIYMAFSTLGARITVWTMNNKSIRPRGFFSVAIVFLPYLFLFVEHNWREPIEHAYAEQDVIIQASPETIWKTLLSVDSISDDEIIFNFSHVIGLPRPRSSSLEQLSIGARRKIVWDQGISFYEKITGYRENEYLEYDIVFDPNLKALKDIDPHIVIGERYFNINRGGYRLDRLSANSTKLTLFTHYQIQSKFNAYGLLWANQIFRDFHNVILHVIKNRAEVAA